MDSHEPSILIVDDEQKDLALVEQSLAPLGFRLSALQDPHHLLHRVESERPDLVILDALLPGLSGFDLCKQIKSAPDGKSTLVVILTGVYLKEQIRREAINQFKADGFMTKPYRPTELQRLVLRLLAKKLKTTPGVFGQD
jgi:CheY-like chemotaxis protein